MGLNAKQKTFVQEYLIDLNASQAALRAGYSKKRFGEIGYQLLQKTSIQAAIKAAMDARAERTEITQDRVLKEFARLAFLDPRRFFDDNGNLISITDLDDDTAACLAGIDVSTKYVKNQDDELEPDTIKKIKFTDKKGALDSVARHLGMFGKDNDQKTGAKVIVVGAVKE